jgi:ubiquinone/menaquinone biosynthesis methyltransferase
VTETENAAAFDPGADNVFARIAGRYDRLCDIFSLYAHRYWKATMARRISAHPGVEVLDIACGTADIPLRIAKRTSTPPKRIVGGDICPEMLAIGRSKIRAFESRISLNVLDAHRLEAVHDESVDIYSIAFGLKICDRSRVLAEAHRVLRPGGALFCLEASRIPVDFIHRLYLRYMDLVLPVIARLATRGDRSAYDYLLRGVHDFPGAAALCEEFEERGFEAVSYSLLTFGIVALHVARKPLSPDRPSK